MKEATSSSTRLPNSFADPQALSGLSRRTDKGRRRQEQRRQESGGQRRQERTACLGGTARRSDSLEEKEDNKDTAECPDPVIIFLGRRPDARRVRVTASRRTRPSHRDCNTKNECCGCLIATSKARIPPFFGPNGSRARYPPLANSWDSCA